MNAVIVCPGTIPLKEELLLFLKPGFILIAADGAANRLLEDDIWPDVVIGDFDSISTSTLEALEKRNIETICKVSQDRCDLEKALDLCVERHYTHVHIVGMFGGRADYNLANAVVLFQFMAHLSITAVEPHFKMFPHQGSRTFNSSPAQIMSFVPLGVCAGVTLEGVKYTLKNAHFKIGEMGVSNVALGDTFTVTIGEGYAWVFVGDSEYAFTRP